MRPFGSPVQKILCLTSLVSVRLARKNQVLTNRITANAKAFVLACNSSGVIATPFRFTELQIHRFTDLEIGTSDAATRSIA
jgi:hypothetical protein